MLFLLLSRELRYWPRATTLAVCLSIVTAAGAWSPDTALSTADASFHGEDPAAALGWGLAGAGDVNGDGIDDLLVGAQGTVDCPGPTAGQVYLVLGSTGPWLPGQDIDVAEYSYCGEQDGDVLTIVSGAGDVDGDGIGDFLLGAHGNDEAGLDAGQAYLVLGRVDGWPPDMPIGDADASFLGEGAGDAAGHLLSPAGDANGDGLGDFLIGAPYADQGGLWTGKVYLFLGKQSGWQPDTPLSASDASFVGYEQLGLVSTTGGGDLDGDGLDDLTIGDMHYWDPVEKRSGQIHLFHGREWGWSNGVPLLSSDASWVGESQPVPVQQYGSAAYAGFVGDVDGDGLDDLLASAPGFPGTSTGKAYLVLGKESGWAPETPLELANGWLTGEAAPDRFQCGVIGIRGYDADGDGFDDMACSAHKNDQAAQNAGKTYLIRGGADLDGDLGDRIAATFLGADSLDMIEGSLVGDLDADGYDDLAIGSGENDEFGNDAGQVWLFFGAPCVDGDGDGFTDCEECDDTDAAVNPDAMEVCNGIDDDCDPATDENADLDGDGFSLCDGDCDDADDAVHPGADEDCDGIDTDCDGQLGPDEADGDGDGYSICDGDCEDGIPTANPGADEVCDNGVDDDCDGVIDDHDLDCYEVDPGDDDAADDDDDDTGGCECRAGSGPARSDSSGWLAPAALALALAGRRRERQGIVRGARGTG